MRGSSITDALPHARLQRPQRTQVDPGHLLESWVSLLFTSLHHAPRELACALLSRDFCLEVVLPEDRLVPMVPQRLNYVHWLEDLLLRDGGQEGREQGGEREAEGEQVFGIDIGERGSRKLRCLGGHIKFCRDWCLLHIPPARHSHAPQLVFPSHRDRQHICGECSEQCP